MCTPALYTSHKALVTTRPTYGLRNVQTIICWQYFVSFLSPFTSFLPSFLEAASFFRKLASPSRNHQLHLTFFSPLAKIPFFDGSFFLPSPETNIQNLWYCTWKLRPTYLHSVILKANRETARGEERRSWLLENPLARSLFIFVQFGTMHLLQAAKCGQNAQVATRLALE